jgi:hypothetical protein
MQLRTYAKKNSLTAVDVIDALKAHNSNVDWVLTSLIEQSEIDYLNLTFGLSQPQLPQSKERLQLPASESDSQLQTTLPTGELVEQLKQNAANLTADDVETLRVNVQRQIIEENAELAAFRDFQHYQNIYDTTKRSLVVNDIYQRLDVRNKNREKFQNEQELIVSESVTEKSSDLMTEMLGILKADKYKSSFLTSKLEQI